MSSKAQAREKDYERGLRIADRRKAIGLSQDELAHRAGIGRQALSAIENGGDFKTKTLDSLADRKSTRLNSSHVSESRMPSSA